MSGRGNQGCRRKSPKCCSNNDAVSTGGGGGGGCGGGKKKASSKQRPCCNNATNLNPVESCMAHHNPNPIPPCNNNDGDLLCGNNLNGAPSTSRHSAMRQPAPPNPLSTVEAEVDRLVEAAKQFSEKEKLKLKQFYEEEIMKKKKAVIQEFRCAMEREVIAPLKQKLCNYEKELEDLKSKYQKALRASGQKAGSVTSSLSQGELDALHRELKKAHNEKDTLSKMIEQEIKRKSTKAGIPLPEDPDEDDEDWMASQAAGVDEGMEQSVTSRKSSIAKETNTGDETEGEEAPPPLENEQDLDQPKPSGILKQTAANVSPTPSKPKRKKSLKYNDEGKLQIAIVEHHETMDEEDQELPDDTRKLKKKIVELTKALQEAKMFAEEEINELIREQLAREELERTLASIQNENMSLRDRVDQWLTNADILDNGVIGEENSRLRQRIQELENDRSRASIEAELKRLRDELDGVVTEGRKSMELERRKSSYKPPPPEPEPEPEPQSPLRRSKDSDNNAPVCPKCPSIDYDEFTSPYVERIKGLEDRIQELEDQLMTFNELEARIKELQNDSDELAAMKVKMEEVAKELDDLRNIPPPKCPIEEDELNELRNKLKSTELDLKFTKEEYFELQKRTGDLESKNAFLAKSVAEFELEHERHLQLEAMHAQMLEEKRRKSEEARNLAEQLARVEEDDERAHRELEDARHHLDEVESSLKLTQEENDTLHSELDNFKSNLQKEMEEQKRLRESIDKKNIEIKKLESQLAAEKKECEDLRKELDELRDSSEQVKLHRDQLELELKEARSHMERMEREFNLKLKEQAKKAQEQCSELSNRGKCILEHEQKCLNVTNQLAEDNLAMHDRIGQLEQQLEQMVNMENATRNMFREISELQKRATQRTLELEELKKLPETCQLNTTPSFMSNIESLPSLPVPSDERFVSKPMLPAKSKSKKKNDECTLLTKKMRDLEAEREALNAALKDKLSALEAVQKQLDDVSQEGSKLKSELDKACSSEPKEE